MGKIAPSPARASSAPAGQGAGAAHAPVRPGRLWSRLAFAPIIQRQPDPNVDYFPHRTRAKKIDALLNAAPLDAKPIIAELATLGRDPRLVEELEKAYKSIFNKELNTELGAKLKGDDLAEARFHLYAPPPQKEFAEVKVEKEGTEAHKGTTASGGEVTLKTGVEYSRVDKSKYPDAFSVGYEGKDSKEARFIQFLWGEVISTLPGKPAAPVPGTARSLSGNIELTTSHADPKRIVDTIGTSPFYESAGADIRTGTGTRIFDRPAHSFEVVNAEFGKGATLVVERDHFEDYLVVGFRTVYVVNHVVEWTFTAPDKSVRRPVPGTGSAVTGMPADVKAVLVKRFPKFDFIQ
jgi:hypothetical protein